MQCDLRVIPPESFGAALLYFTGSKEHNVVLREMALKKNMSINEYGIFRKGSKINSKPLVSQTEKEMYRALGMDYIPPELRENRGEIQAALKGKLPKLVEEKDIRGDFHNHTDMSDGKDSLEVMVESARAKGWEWVAIADHSPSLKVAHGLTVERLKQKMEKIKAINRKYRGFHVLCSSEVDILSDGNMDYPDEILSELDIVVGSIHSGFKQPPDRITGRILKAMENPYVDCIGHLTGRILNRRPAYAIHVDHLLEGAVRTGTCLEINGQPDRQDMTDTATITGREKGVMFATNTDAHAKNQLDYMSIAVTVARRGWLEKKHIVNCLNHEDLIEKLKRKIKSGS